MFLHFFRREASDVARSSPTSHCKCGRSRQSDPYTAWEAFFKKRKEENEEYRHRYRRRCSTVTEAYFTRLLGGSPYSSAFGTSSGADVSPRPATMRPGDTEPLLPLRQDTPYSFDLFLQTVAGNGRLREYLLTADMERQLGSSLVAPVASGSHLAAKHLAKGLSRRVAQQVASEVAELSSRLSKLQEAGLGIGMRPGICLATARRASTFQTFWKELTAARDDTEDIRYSSYAYTSTLLELRACLTSVKEVTEYNQPTFLVWDDRAAQSPASKITSSLDKGVPLPPSPEACGKEASPPEGAPQGLEDGETLALDIPVVVQEQQVAGPVLEEARAGSARIAPTKDQLPSHVDVYVFFHGYRGGKCDLRYLRDRLIEVNHCKSFLSGARRGGNVCTIMHSQTPDQAWPILSIEDQSAHTSRYVLLQSYEQSTTDSILLQASLAVKEILQSVESAGLVSLTNSGEIRHVFRQFGRLHFIAHSQGCIVAETVLLHHSIAPLLPFLGKFVGIQGPNFGMYTRRRIVRLGFKCLMLGKKEVALRELGLHRISLDAGEESRKANHLAGSGASARSDLHGDPSGEVLGSVPSPRNLEPSASFLSLAQQFGIELKGKRCLVGLIAEASKLSQFAEVCLFGSYNDGYVHPFSSLALQTWYGDAETVSALRKKYWSVPLVRRCLVSYDERELKAKYKVFDRMTKRTGHIKPLIDYWAVCGIVGLI